MAGIQDGRPDLFQHGEQRKVGRFNGLEQVRNLMPGQMRRRQTPARDRETGKQQRSGNYSG